MKISITVEDISIDQVHKLLKIVDEFNKDTSLCTTITPELDFSSNTELSKYRIFMAMFSGVYGHFGEKDVNWNAFVRMLIDTKKIKNRDEANKYLKIALSNGDIYERRKGYYAKT